jgi:hypothetical protein
MKIEGSGSESGSISQRHGSTDPDTDPHQNVMDPQHYHKGLPSVYVSRWPRGRRKRGNSFTGVENQEPETESGMRIPKEEPGQQGGGENGDEQGTGEEESFLRVGDFLTLYYNNNNNNNNLFSIRYSNTLSCTIYKVLLYNIGIKKIGNSRLLVFVYNKIL